MEVEVVIYKKDDDVLVLCNSPGCSKVEAHKGTLEKKGYGEVSVLPVTIQCSSADSVLQFLIQGEDKVGSLPRDHKLQIRRVKPGAPYPMSFKCYSASGGDSTVALVTMENGSEVDRQVLDVTCKKKEIRAPEGPSGSEGSNVSFMGGGNVGNVHMDQAKVNVTGSQHNYTPTTHNYHGDVNCDKSEKRIAQNMADHGGQMTITQHGTTNTQCIGKE